MEISTAVDDETGMIVKRLSVPMGLEELMEGLTKEVLRKKPNDIFTFASQHFTDLLALRDTGAYQEQNRRPRNVKSIEDMLEKRVLKSNKSTANSKLLARQISIRSTTPVKKHATFAISSRNYRSNDDNNTDKLERKTKSEATKMILDRRKNKRLSSSSDSGKEKDNEPVKVTQKRFTPRKPADKKEKLVDKSPKIKKEIPKGSPEKKVIMGSLEKKVMVGSPEKKVAVGSPEKKVVVGSPRKSILREPAGKKLASGKKKVVGGALAAAGAAAAVHAVTKSDAKEVKEVVEQSAIDLVESELKIRDEKSVINETTEVASKSDNSSNVKKEEDNQKLDINVETGESIVEDDSKQETDQENLSKNSEQTSEQKIESREDAESSKEKDKDVSDNKLNDEENQKQSFDKIQSPEKERTNKNLDEPKEKNADSSIEKSLEDEKSVDLNSPPTSSTFDKTVEQQKDRELSLSSTSTQQKQEDEQSKTPETKLNTEAPKENESKKHEENNQQVTANVESSLVNETKIISPSLSQMSSENNLIDDKDEKSKPAETKLNTEVSKESKSKKHEENNQQVAANVESSLVNEKKIISPSLSQMSSENNLIDDKGQKSKPAETKLNTEVSKESELNKIEEGNQQVDANDELSLVNEKVITPPLLSQTILEKNNLIDDKGLKRHPTAAGNIEDEVDNAEKNDLKSKEPEISEENTKSTIDNSQIEDNSENKMDVHKIIDDTKAEAENQTIIESENKLVKTETSEKLDKTDLKEADKNKVNEGNKHFPEVMSNDSNKLHEELAIIEEEKELNKHTTSYNPHKLRQEIKSVTVDDTDSETIQEIDANQIINMNKTEEENFTKQIQPVFNKNIENNLEALKESVTDVKPRLNSIDLEDKDIGENEDKIVKKEDLETNQEKEGSNSMTSLIKNEKVEENVKVPELQNQSNEERDKANITTLSDSPKNEDNKSENKQNIKLDEDDRTKISTPPGLEEEKQIEENKSQNLEINESKNIESGNQDIKITPERVHVNNTEVETIKNQGDQQSNILQEVKTDELIANHQNEISQLKQESELNDHQKEKGIANELSNAADKISIEISGQNGDEQNIENIHQSKDALKTEEPGLNNFFGKTILPYTATPEKLVTDFELSSIQKPQECDELPHQRGLGDLASKAATTIQAGYRGYTVRKNCKSEISKDTALNKQTEPLKKIEEESTLETIKEEQTISETDDASLKITNSLTDLGTTANKLTDSEVEDALKQLDRLTEPGEQLKIVQKASAGKILERAVTVDEPEFKKVIVKQLTVPVIPISTNSFKDSAEENLKAIVTNQGDEIKNKENNSKDMTEISLKLNSLKDLSENNSEVNISKDEHTTSDDSPRTKIGDEEIQKNSSTLVHEVHQITVNETEESEMRDDIKAATNASPIVIKDTVDSEQLNDDLKNINDNLDKSKNDSKGDNITEKAEEDSRDKETTNAESDVEELAKVKEERSEAKPSEVNEEMHNLKEETNLNINGKETISEIKIKESDAIHNENDVKTETEKSKNYSELNKSKEVSDSGVDNKAENISLLKKGNEEIMQEKEIKTHIIQKIQETDKNVIETRSEGNESVNNLISETNNLKLLTKKEEKKDDASENIEMKENVDENRKEADRSQNGINLRKQKSLELIKSEEEGKEKVPVNINIEEEKDTMKGVQPENDINLITDGKSLEVSKNNEEMENDKTKEIDNNKTEEIEKNRTDENIEENKKDQARPESGKEEVKNNIIPNDTSKQLKEVISSDQFNSTIAETVLLTPLEEEVKQTIDNIMDNNNNVDAEINEPLLDKESVKELQVAETKADDFVDEDVNKNNSENEESNKTKSKYDSEKVSDSTLKTKLDENNLHESENTPETKQEMPETDSFNEAQLKKIIGDSANEKNKISKQVNINDETEVQSCLEEKSAADANKAPPLITVEAPVGNEADIERKSDHTSGHAAIKLDLKRLDENNQDDKQTSLDDQKVSAFLDAELPSSPEKINGGESLVVENTSEYENAPTRPVTSNVTGTEAAGNENKQILSDSERFAEKQRDESFIDKNILEKKLNKFEECSSYPTHVDDLKNDKNKSDQKLSSISDIPCSEADKILDKEQLQSENQNEISDKQVMDVSSDDDGKYFQERPLSKDSVTSTDSVVTVVANPKFEKESKAVIEKPESNDEEILKMKDITTNKDTGLRDEEKIEGKELQTKKFNLVKQEPVSEENKTEYDLDNQKLFKSTDAETVVASVEKENEDSEKIDNFKTSESKSETFDMDKKVLEESKAENESNKQTVKDTDAFKIDVARVGTENGVKTKAANLEALTETNGDINKEKIEESKTKNDSDDEKNQDYNLKTIEEENAVIEHSKNITESTSKRVTSNMIEEKKLEDNKSAKSGDKRLKNTNSEDVLVTKSIKNIAALRKSASEELTSTDMNKEKNINDTKSAKSGDKRLKDNNSENVMISKGIKNVESLTESTNEEVTSIVMNKEKNFEDKTSAKSDDKKIKGGNDEDAIVRKANIEALAQSKIEEFISDIKLEEKIKENDAASVKDSESRDKKTQDTSNAIIPVGKEIKPSESEKSSKAEEVTNNDINKAKSLEENKTADNIAAGGTDKKLDNAPMKLKIESFASNQEKHLDKSENGTVLENDKLKSSAKEKNETHNIVNLNDEEQNSEENKTPNIVTDSNHKELVIANYNTEKQVEFRDEKESETEAMGESKIEEESIKSKTVDIKELQGQSKNLKDTPNAIIDNSSVAEETVVNEIKASENENTSMTKDTNEIGTEEINQEKEIEEKHSVAILASNDIKSESSIISTSNIENDKNPSIESEINEFTNQETIFPESAPVSVSNETTINEDVKTTGSEEKSQENNTQETENLIVSDNKSINSEIKNIENEKSNENNENSTNEVPEKNGTLENKTSNIINTAVQDLPKEETTTDIADPNSAAKTIQSNYRKYRVKRDLSNQPKDPEQNLIKENQPEDLKLHKGVQEYIDSVTHPAALAPPNRQFLNDVPNMEAKPSFNESQSEDEFITAAYKAHTDEKSPETTQTLLNIKVQSPTQSTSPQEKTSSSHDILLIEQKSPENTILSQVGTGIQSPTVTIGLHHSGEFHDVLVIPESGKGTEGHSLLHSGEFHDTVTFPLESGQNGSPVQTGVVRSGQLHSASLPLAVHLNQPPAGAETLTSSKALPFSAENDSHITAQALVKDASTRREDDYCSTMPDSARSITSMEAEKRNNAAILQKNMESQAATKIQASFRGYQVRKQLKSKNGGIEATNQGRITRRKSSGKITPKGDKGVKTNELEDRSATKIQAGVRGFLVRRRQKNGSKKSTPESS